jgi:hypothetical protein
METSLMTEIVLDGEQHKEHPLGPLKSTLTRNVDPSPIPVPQLFWEEMFWTTPGRSINSQRLECQGVAVEASLAILWRKSE